MSPGTLLLILIWSAASTVISTIVGDRKGRQGTGLALGLLLGWIGVIIAAMMPATRARLVQRERERLAIEREARG